MSAVDDREITITWLTWERFRASPQVGLLVTQDAAGILRSLTWPRVASSKSEVGAWCPAALDGGRVKGGRGPVALLVADVDECAEGALDHEADALRGYAGAVIPTFNATKEKPKNRIVLLPSRALTADEFPVAWGKLAYEFARAGIVVDRGCKNINRLYFACVTRSPATWLGARLLTGEPVDVDGLLDAARHDAEIEREQRAKLAAVRPVSAEHGDRYVQAALERARVNVASAGEGQRNVTLNAEAFALARLDKLDDTTIASTLEDAARAAGLPAAEATKTIASALRARRRTA